MWTDTAETTDADQTSRASTRAAAARETAAETAAAAARRRGADREIRRRPLCRHGGYSGADPVSGVTLCAICRQADTDPEAAER